MTIYRFFGHVISQSTRLGLPALRVEAWDAEDQCTDLIAFAITDAQGAFTMALDDTYLAEFFQDRSPTITFRVFATGEVMVPLATRGFLWKLVAESTSGRIEAGSAITSGGTTSPDQRQPAPSVVRGRVLSATGEPLVGIAVKAFDRTLSAETPETQLGTIVRTVDGGQYHITYVPAGGSAGRITPDLVVRAYNAEGTVLVESERICQAPATATVNLVVGGVLRGPSELDALQARIAAHVMGRDLQTTTDEQREHLACASKSNPAHVNAFIAAGALSAETRVSVAAHYALLREGLPESRRELLRLPPREMRRALQSAIARNTVSDAIGDVETIVGQLRAAAVDMAFEVPAGATGSVGGLVATVLRSDFARTFLDKYLAHEGDIEDFWTGLPTAGQMPDITAAQIADLQLAFQLGALTRFHFPLIEELQEQKGQGAFTSLRDLAKWDEAKWSQVLDRARGGQIIGYPADTPGENEDGRPDEDAKKANYATVLRRALSLAHPTAAIAGDIERVTSSSDPVVEFIDRNQDFEVGKTRVMHYLEQNEITLADETVTRLRQIELLHKLTPRYGEMQVLLDAGLHSARDVLRVGRTAFIAGYATALGGEAIAEEIFANAHHTATQALALQSKFGAAMNPKGAYAVADQATPKAGAQAPEAADWAKLFGSPDFCECAHCNAVYGPAAYFVDLLEFLGKHESNVAQGGSTPTAKQVLLQKRPDLAHVDLSCDNTLVPLPYVDLVNEILEHAVGTPSAAYPTHIATVGEAKDLRALPVVNKAANSAYANAYGALATAVHPWSLPFDLGATEARVYLNHLGVPRHELMGVLQYQVESAPDGYDSTIVPRPEDIAAERLGLSRSERLVIVNSSLATPLSLPGLWGLPAVADPNLVNQALSQLTSVPVFLKQSGLTYDELVDLLDTAFAQGFGHPHLSATDPCDTSTMSIVWSDPSHKRAFFDAAHRFVRLAKRIGYSFREFDQAMTSPSSAIDDALLAKLATIEGLRARFGLPVAVVASWFGDLETYQRWSTKDAPYYDLVFQNRGVQNPPDPGLSATSPSGNLGDHAATLRAALRIGAEDFALLTDTAVCEAQTSGEALLSGTTPVAVDKLSLLHRHVSFARALGLSLRDFLILKALGGSSFDPFDPATAEAFIALIDRVRRVRLGAADLLYLFAGRTSPAAEIVPSRAAILATLDGLVAGLVKLRNEKAEVADPEGEQLRKLLVDTIGNATLRGHIWALVDSDTPDEIEESVFDDHMAAFCWDPASAKDKLVGAGAHVLRDKADRYGFALAEMSMKLDGERLIQQALGAALRLDARRIDALLRTVLTAAPPATRALLDTFRFLPQFAQLPAPVPDPRSLPQDRYDAQCKAYEHLDKAATIVRRLGMTADEIVALAKPGTTPAPMFPIDALPRTAGDPDTALFARFQTLVDVLAMRPAMAGGSAGLLAVLGILLDIPGARDQTPSTYDPSAVAQAIRPHTGWPASDVAALLTTGYLQHIATLPHDVQKAGDLLLWLRDSMAAVRRLGVSAQTAIGWILPPSLAVFDATPIIQAAKAKHTETEWTSVAPPLRDVIRDKQRNALVAYLMTERQYTDKNQLFNDLYIDVEMAPCQLTSRIKQAISSVQTFVQRALLHLEPGAKLTEEAAREWSWRRSYRVWEANRKIFLYPENWIYPELRDDKSPFFKQLERDLRQKDITDEVAEDAFARYLESLADVAKLGVVAMFHQEEPSDGEHDAIDVLHVVGRTRLEPYKYFYRTRVDGSYWTPWEAIDLDIEADHLIVAVMHRRVHLFWPVIEKRPDDQQPKGSTTAAGPPATKHLEVRLAWSQYHNKKWSARRVSKDDPITLSPSVDPKWLTFVLEGETKIVCFLNPGHWIPWHRGLFRLGTFALRSCSGQVDNTNRELTFSNPRAEMVAAARLVEKARKEEEIDPEQAEKDMAVALEQVQKALATTAVLQGQLDAEQSTEYMLTLPSLSVRVYQDDKQIPDHRIDDSMPDDGDRGTLTLPLVLDSGAQRFPILGHTPSRFRVLAQHGVGARRKDKYRELALFFYKDADHTFFAQLQTSTQTAWTKGSKAHPGYTLPLGDGMVRSTDFRGGVRQLDVVAWAVKPPEESLFSHTYTTKGYRFWTFYHPYACDYLKALHHGGVAGLLQWPRNPAKKSIQFLSKDVFSQTSQYAPKPDVVSKPYPLEDVDFSFGGAYSLYNWEIFFHIPFLVATRLMQNQRFDEAQKWLHYIFDPTSGGKTKAPQRFWKVKPFFENHDLATIQQELLQAVSDPEAPVSKATDAVKKFLQAEDSLAREEFDAQVTAWEKNPFNPHVIARLRPLAYQKAVVMTYIENLIAWGDQLFRRDTLESINEATQLYILASQLLGPRPVGIRRTDAPPAKTYAQIEGLDMGPLSDPLMPAESLVRASGKPASKIAGAGAGMAYEPPPDLEMLLFCVPPDEMLLGLWDTVADRLFKLRHCMNIEGVVRQLPLFEPPIDPALLVRAAAAGVDLASALDDLSVPLPHYRFSVMHAKAMELASGVAALGGAFLSALEKKDAEGLSRLRSRQEIDMLKAVREVKREQLREAEEALKGLEKAREVTTTRRDYYASVKRISPAESTALATNGVAMALSAIAQGLASGASAGYHVPLFTGGGAGTFGTPVSTVGYGGYNAGSSADASSRAVSIAASTLHEAGAIMTTLAGYDRRWDEWKLQERLANKELQQIERQIAAAEIRVAIAEKDLENHDLQITHAREAGDYLRDKFTSEELYDWMSAELSTVYFQSYKLAYDLAKRAEKAYRYERAVEGSSYVTFGYWDSLKNGLLAGERLQHDLRRLEVAYLEQNAREYEVTKHVSLASLDPAELMKLRDTGTCTFKLEEAQFDLDYPGHYLRRIKSVSVTIPTVNGPYTGINCTLRLTRSSVRKSTNNADASSYPRNDAGGSDRRFADGYTPVSATIVTSSAQSDGGLFELNFRDERYLPFEGAGAISTWEISLPRATNGFDVSTISDVILHVRYTAREGGSTFATSAKESVFQQAQSLPPRRRLVSLRTEFPDAWAQFMASGSASAPQELSFQLDGSMLPYLFGWEAVTLNGLDLYVLWQGGRVDPTPPTQAVGWYSVGNPLKVSIKKDGQAFLPPPPPDPAPPEVPPPPPTKWTLAAGLGATGQSNLGHVPLKLPSAVTGTWVIQAESGDIGNIAAALRTTSGGVHRLDDSLQDIYLLVEYKQTVPAWA